MPDFTYTARGQRIVAVCAALLVASQASGGGVEAEVLALINHHRAAAGCPPLAIEKRLTAVAKLHARAMAEQDFFAHNSKGGPHFGQRVRAQGYSFGQVAENIAMGQPSAREVVAGWMTSKSHRKNILNCGFTDTGIGMTYQADDAPLKGRPLAMKYYWVQDFGHP